MDFYGPCPSETRFPTLCSLQRPVYCPCGTLTNVPPLTEQFAAALDTVLAARNGAGAPEPVAIQIGENVVADAQRLSAFDSPNGAFTHEWTLAIWKAVGITGVSQLQPH